MMRALTTLFLLLAFAFGIQAQENAPLASARKRGLKGAVHIVLSKCSNINGEYEIRYKFEYDRDGTLRVIESPQWNVPIVGDPRSHKITKRNHRGDVEEISYFYVKKGDVTEKERYEYEYDSAGNWVKQVTYLMRNYSMEGASWKEGEWQAKYVCNRAIEYYP
jgi:hypothetical protein